MIQAPNQHNQPAPHPGFWRRNLVWIILVAVPLVVPLSIFGVWQAQSTSAGAEPISYRLFIEQVQDYNVVSVTLTDNSVTGTFKNPVASDDANQTSTKFTTNIPNLPNENPVPTLKKYGVKVNVNPDNSNSIQTLLLQWGPFLLLAVMMYLVVVGCLALYVYVRSRPR